MTDQEMLALGQLKQIMVEVADQEEENVVMDAELVNDLGLDELDYAYIAEELEEYGIELPMENEFRTVADLVDYICQRYILLEDDE